MGAERSVVNTKWFSIRSGKFTIEATKDDHDIVVAGTGNTPDKYYFAYDSISGMLTDISFRFPDDVKYGEEVIFTLLDEGVKHKFSMQVSGRVGKALLMRLPNLTVGKFLKVSAFLGKPDNPNDKPYNMVAVYMGDEFGHNYEKLPAFYTKDVPNGLPPMARGFVGTKEVWDDSEQVAFLKNMVFSYYIPELKKVGYGQDSGQINTRSQAGQQGASSGYQQRPTASPNQVTSPQPPAPVWNSTAGVWEYPQPATVPPPATYFPPQANAQPAPVPPPAPAQRPIVQAAQPAAYPPPPPPPTAQGQSSNVGEFSGTGNDDLPF